MESTTALLQRHCDALDRHTTQVVEARDSVLAEVLPQASLHSDSVQAGDRFTTAALPTLPASTERAVIVLPKSRPRLDMVLAVLAGQCTEPLELWLVGPNRAGIRGGVTQLRRYARAVEAVDSAQHCKLYRGWLEPGPALGLTDFASTFWWEDRAITSYPGVFSHGRLDPATADLLAVLADEPDRGQALDLGCGAGTLTLGLTRAGHDVTAVDTSRTALAATRATLAPHGYQARLVHGDLYAGLATFDSIWSNPPFHQGTLRTLTVAERLITEAPNHLRPGGRLTLVANRELPYPQWLDRAFGRHQILRENNRFRVYRAHRR